MDDATAVGTRHVRGQEWDICESNPAGAGPTVLMLPGGMCTAGMFADIIGALAGAPVHVVAATLPGFGRTPHPADVTIENYAALVGELAEAIGAAAVAGHSLGANVALELGAAGDFDGPLLLLSPSFSTQDEYRELRVLDRIGRVPGAGQLAWLGALKAMGGAVPKSIPEPQRGALGAVLKNNDAGFCRHMVRDYFVYLDRHGSLVPRLCESGRRAHVVFGDHDEVGLTDDERAGLNDCASVTLTTIEDATHFLVAERPERVAELILELVGASAHA